MTENQRFDSVFDRIQAAKKRPAFKTWPQFSLTVMLSERLLGLGNLPMAEFEICKAENILLTSEIRAMALKIGSAVLPDVEYFLAQDRIDAALELVLA